MIVKNPFEYLIVRRYLSEDSLDKSKGYLDYVYEHIYNFNVPTRMRGSPVGAHMPRVSNER
jgi:hypothetical protein